MQVLDMIEKWVKTQGSDITALLRCGLLDSLSSMLTVSPFCEIATATVRFRAFCLDDFFRTDGSGECVTHCSCDQETSAWKHEQHALSALVAVLWHSDAAEGIVQPTAVMAIGQWCETKMQAMHFQADAFAEHEGILKSILPILGAISSSLLKPNVVAAFLSTNEALLQELLQNKKLALETCSLVLLSLRRYCQADQKYRALRFRFFQVVFIEAGCAVVL